MTMKNKRRLKSLLKYFVLTCFLVLTMFPFVWMLLTSLKGSQGEIYAFPVRYMPNPASAVNYVAMLWKGNFGRYMLNSFSPQRRQPPVRCLLPYWPAMS